MSFNTAQVDTSYIWFPSLLIMWWQTITARYYLLLRYWLNRVIRGTHSNTLQNLFTLFVYHPFAHKRNWQHITNHLCTVAGCRFFFLLLNFFYLVTNCLKVSFAWHSWPLRVVIILWILLLFKYKRLVWTDPNKTLVFY